MPDYATFLSYFPEFGDATKYPQERVLFWINIAVIQLSSTRWGSLYAYGIYLYIAHKITLEFVAGRAAATGNNTGRGLGPISSSSIDSVAYSVDTSKSAYEGAGYWNETIYGRNFWQLAQQIGSGGIQLGINYDTPPVQTGLIPV